MSRLKTGLRFLFLTLKEIYFLQAFSDRPSKLKRTGVSNLLHLHEIHLE